LNSGPSPAIAALGDSAGARWVILAREDGSAVVATQDRSTALTDALYAFCPPHFPDTTDIDALYAEMRLML
jgi:hypothetical protein